MFAVIKTGGKQYVVSPGMKLKVEKLPQGEGENFEFPEVLMTFNDDTADIGTPILPEAKVTAKVLRHGRARKITNLRYHSKTRHRRKKGHRQQFTEVEIVEVR